MAARKTQGKKLAVNTTVGDTTYPAGTVLEADVAALIDNPNVWGDDAPAKAVEDESADTTDEGADAGDQSDD